jgi:hypothetical protein
MYAVGVALEPPSSPVVKLRHELVADVVRCLGYVSHAQGVAERAGANAGVVAELADIEDRLTALHLVALFAGGWCPRCGAELTDPGRSPSGLRHCRSCRLGWTLVEQEGRVRAVERAWPAKAGAAGRTT